MVIKISNFVYYTIYDSGTKRISQPFATKNNCHWAKTSCKDKVGRASLIMDENTSTLKLLLSLFGKTFEI